MGRLGGAHKGADELSSAQLAFDTFSTDSHFCPLSFTHTQTYSVRRKVHAQTHAYTQIASIAIRPAILQLDKGSWQIVTPLPLSAWTVLPLPAVMRDCLFTVAVLLACLFSSVFIFSSVDAGAGEKEDLMMLWYGSRKRGTRVKKGWRSEWVCI